MGTAVVIAHISKHPNVTGDLAWLAVAKRPVLSALNDVHVVKAIFSSFLRTCHVVYYVRVNLTLEYHIEVFSIEAIRF